MVQWQMKSKRKTTGGLLKRHSKKKKHQRGRDYLPVHIGSTLVRELRVRGGNKKLVTLKSNIANVLRDGKAQKAKILGVVENPADAQFIRRNIITKGAVIETELGRARVTSRPGQDGIVNAVVIEERKKS